LRLYFSLRFLLRRPLAAGLFFSALVYVCVYEIGIDFLFLSPRGRCEMARSRLQLRDHYGWFPRLAALLSRSEGFFCKTRALEKGN
jgi:hypothetical protein